MKPVIFLLAACAFSLLLVIPSIKYNVDDPNMITYMNLDEGELMDLCWYYYSGEKRASFIWEEDYGLEMPYLMDICRMIPKNIVSFTPGTIVLLVRWIHLAGWMLSLVALWSLVGRHFARGWQQVSAVSLLAVRPAFAYFPNNLKPEPLVLFFMILGLDYCLRIIDEPRRRNILLAVLFASVAFLVKYAGIFILPAAVWAMYLASRRSDKPLFPKLKFAWSLPLMVGVMVLAFVFYILFFYVSKSTGKTWYSEFGLVQSVLRNKYALAGIAISCLLAAFSFLLFVLGRKKGTVSSKIAGFINEINSYSILVSAVFTGFCLLLGIKWLIKPELFLMSHSWVGPVFINEAANMAGKIMNADILVIAVFVFYIFTEMQGNRARGKDHPPVFYKRMVLVAFLVPFFMMITLPGNIKQHHMLPFFVAISILAAQGIAMAQKHKLAVLIAAAVIIFDVAANGIWLAKARLYQFSQGYDVAYEVRDWMRNNLDKDAVIASDHYIRAYIPDGYKNVKIFNAVYRDNDPKKQLKAIIAEYKPEYIYYNEGPRGGAPLAPLNELLPGGNALLVKEFDSAGRRYISSEGDKFVIYRAIYQQGTGK